MNISGSLSIKTSMIGGKASGSYIDSDKFKSSDINFHLQVRVTNQMSVSSRRFKCPCFSSTNLHFCSMLR